MTTASTSLDRPIEDIFRRLAEEGRDMVFRYRVHPRRGFEYVSPASTTVLGYTPAELCADPDVYRRIVLSTDQAFLDAASHDDLRQIYIVNARRKDGSRLVAEVSSVLHIDESGRMVLVDGIARDVTDQWRLREALRRSEERFRAVFDGSPIGMGISDLDGQVVEVNDALCRFLGYPREELVGRTIAHLSPPEEVSGIAERLKNLSTGAVSSYQIDRRHIRKDGRTVWAHVTASLLRDEEGNPRFGLAIIEDITERKTLQDALLQRASEARGRLSAMTARELEILEQLSSGLSARQLAQQFHISVRTAESHIASAYRKLGARSKRTAIREFRLLKEAVTYEAVPPAQGYGENISTETT